MNGFVRFILRIYFDFNLYRLWSKIYQFIWERKREPLRVFRDFDEFVGYVRTLKWRPDTWRQLWDAVGHPKHVQYLANWQPSKLVGDCDEFSVYNMAVIQNQFLDMEPGSTIKQPIVAAKMLTVIWKDEAGHYGGHNVTLICHANGFRYMDYGYPSSRVDNVELVVGQVMHDYQPRGELIFYAVSDSDLKCELCW